MQHITNAYVCLKFDLILKIHVVQAKMVIMMMLLDIGLLSWFSLLAHRYVFVILRDKHLGRPFISALISYSVTISDQCSGFIPEINPFR